MHSSFFVVVLVVIVVFIDMVGVRCRVCSGRCIQCTRQMNGQKEKQKKKILTSQV